jgi:hypothetical protein
MVKFWPDQIQTISIIIESSIGQHCYKCCFVNECCCCHCLQTWGLFLCAQDSLTQSWKTLDGYEFRFYENRNWTTVPFYDKPSPFEHSKPFYCDILNRNHFFVFRFVRDFVLKMKYFIEKCIISQSFWFVTLHRYSNW